MHLCKFPKDEKRAYRCILLGPPFSLTGKSRDRGARKPPAKLLIEKGVITEAEFVAKIAEERATSRESSCDSFRRESFVPC